MGSTAFPSSTDVEAVPLQQASDPEPGLDLPWLQVQRDL